MRGIDSAQAESLARDFVPAMATEERAEMREAVREAMAAILEWHKIQGV